MASLTQVGAGVATASHQSIEDATRQVLWNLTLMTTVADNVNHHESKKDRIVLYNKNDFGYLLPTALLILDRDGASLCDSRQ